MRRFSMAGSMLLAAVWLASPASTQGQGNSADSTGATDPQDVIAARQVLMFAIEDLMKPIDTYTVEDDGDPAALTATASTIAAMLLTVPHLFPAATNLYDPDADAPETLALPAIWEDFPAFYAMAQAAVTAAMTMAEKKDADEVRTGALGLRASCDACHALYLRPYVRSKVTQEDLDFDFDSLFEN